LNEKKTAMNSLQFMRNNEFHELTNVGSRNGFKNDKMLKMNESLFNGV